jgi:hypothetical protein
LANPLTAIRQHAEYAGSVLKHLSTLDASNEALHDEIQDLVTNLGASIDVVQQQLRAADEYLEHYITSDEVNFDEGDDELLAAVDEVIEHRRRLADIIDHIGSHNRPHPSYYHSPDAALARARELIPGAIVQQLDDGRISLVSNDTALTIARSGNVVAFENAHVRYDARPYDFPTIEGDGTSSVLQGAVTGYLSTEDARIISTVSTGRHYSEVIPPRDQRFNSSAD